MSTPSPSPDAGLTRYRKLRMAWSGACGLLAVLLIMLWVRSYWVADVIGRIDLTPSDRILTGLFSDEGTFSFDRHTLPLKNSPSHKDGWTHYTFKPAGDQLSHLNMKITSKQFAIKVPTWLPAILLAGAAAIPWMGLKWNFSLYTLLVATTVLALVLWLVVLVARH